MLSFIFIIIGIALLVKGASWLVEGGASLAKRLHISDLVIGLTVIAFGTSLPELFVNVAASLQGKSEIAIGNIMGSNIANIFLILGVAGIIYPLAVHSGTVWKEIPLSLLAAVLVGVLANDMFIDGRDSSALTRSDGIVFILFFAVFLAYIFAIAKKHDVPEVETKIRGAPASLLLILTGLIMLAIGGKLTVDGAAQLAQSFGVSQSFIALTVIAVGTSLPEFATSAVAAYKKNSDIAVGNIVGSNIFNIFCILGISAVLKPLPFQYTSNRDVFVVIGSSLLLFAWMFIGKKHTLDRWQAVMLLVMYAAYIGYLVIGG